MRRFAVGDVGKCLEESRSLEHGGINVRLSMSTGLGG